MTLEEFKTSLTEEQKEKLKAVITKQQNLTDEDIETVMQYIKDSAQALGEDQITEPIRYIVSSFGGLRDTDLLAIIGEEFNPETFSEWVNILEPQLLLHGEYQEAKVYNFTPELLNKLQAAFGESSHKSCASDLGFYFLEHKEAGDIFRDQQITHMLLDGGETAAVAEYVSQAEGIQLQQAVVTLGQALRDAPDEVKQCVMDLPRCEGEKINHVKLLMLLLNDCLGSLGNPQLQKPIIERLTPMIDQLCVQGHPELKVIAEIARLRVAQIARLLQSEQEAQAAFTVALNTLLPSLQQADPAKTTTEQIRQYWIALKICQEMVQPKAIAVIFEAIIKLEQAQTQDTNRSEEERGRIAEDITNQHIDMAKLYYAFPPQVQEQFTNYTEPTLVLLNAFLQSSKEEGDNNDLSMEDLAKLSGYYQSLGELSDHVEKHEESYNALVEAQILQMRLVGMYQKAEGDKMSPQALLQRLALSVTNHMLGMHYRRQSKSQHDLSVLLTANMNLAMDCFKAYPRDGRVIHFAVNAALELGDFQHRTGGLLAECGTYEKVIRGFVALNNLRIDQQLCQDMAMIHTKCGQAQCDDKIRRYGDAVRNLEVAHKLWNTMAESTKNEEYKKNAEVVAQLINKFKKN